MADRSRPVQQSVIEVARCGVMCVNCAAAGGSSAVAVLSLTHPPSPPSSPSSPRQPPRRRPAPPPPAAAAAAAVARCRSVDARRVPGAAVRLCRRRRALSRLSAAAAAAGRPTPSAQPRPPPAQGDDPHRPCAQQGLRKRSSVRPSVRLCVCPIIRP